MDRNSPYAKEVAARIAFLQQQQRKLAGSAGSSQSRSMLRPAVADPAQGDDDSDAQSTPGSLHSHSDDGQLPSPTSIFPDVAHVAVATPEALSDAVGSDPKALRPLADAISLSIPKGCKKLSGGGAYAYLIKLAQEQVASQPSGKKRARSPGAATSKHVTPSAVKKKQKSAAAKPRALPVSSSDDSPDPSSVGSAAAAAIRNKRTQPPSA